MHSNTIHRNLVNLYTNAYFPQFTPNIHAEFQNISRIIFSYNAMWGNLFERQCVLSKMYLFKNNTF